MYIFQDSLQKTYLLYLSALTQKHPPHTTSQNFMEVLISLIFPGQMHNLAPSPADRVLVHPVQVTAAGEQQHKWHCNLRQLTNQQILFTAKKKAHNWPVGALDPGSRLYQSRQKLIWGKTHVNSRWNDLHVPQSLPPFQTMHCHKTGPPSHCSTFVWFYQPQTFYEMNLCR